MAISFDVSAVKRYKVVTSRWAKGAEHQKRRPPGTDAELKAGGWTEHWAASTDALVYYLGLFIGIREITEENVPEVMWRLKVYDAAEGCLLQSTRRGKRIARPLTEKEVRQHVGMKVWGRHTSVYTATGFMADLARRHGLDSCRRSVVEQATQQVLHSLLSEGGARTSAARDDGGLRSPP